MKNSIHSTALVDKKANIGPQVTVGPYTVIGPGVQIGKNSKISNHVTIGGDTQIGERCVISPGACLGMPPQMKKKNFTETSLRVGDDNIIREYVTMSTGIIAGSKTSVGNRNYFMTGVHIAHDCVIGSDITVANSAAFAGHVIVEDQAVISGFVGVHQFVRVGKLSLIGGLSKVVSDVPPYSICDGHPARFYGINSVGLKRAGISSAEALMIRKILRTLLKRGSRMTEEFPKIQKEFKGNPHMELIVSFLKKSERGVCRVE